MSTCAYRYPDGVRCSLEPENHPPGCEHHWAKQSVSEVARLTAALAERDATIARVHALADEWEQTLTVAQWRRQAAKSVRAALAGESDA